MKSVLSRSSPSSTAQIECITKCSGTQIRTANADLDHRFDFLAGGTLDLSASDLLGEIPDLCKFAFIEVALLHPVRHDAEAIKGAASCKLVQDEALFSRVHDFSAQESLVLLNQLLLVCKLLKRIDDCLIDGHGRVVVAKASGFPDDGLLYPLSTEIILDIKRLLCLELGKAFRTIQISVIDHNHPCQSSTAGILALKLS